MLLLEILFDDDVFVPLMLHRLVKTNWYSIIRLYLQHGYTITEHDSEGKYAYEYAREEMDEKLYNQLIPARSYAPKSQSQSEITSNSDDDDASVCSATSAASSKKRVSFIDETSDTGVTSHSG